MQPFQLAQDARNDYRRFIQTTYPILDPALRAQFDDLIANGNLLWKGPYVTLGRRYEAGAGTAALVREGLLQAPVDQIFPFASLHAHQVEAIRRLRERRNTLVATGTGSGKTESFLIPIVDHCLRMRRDGHGGTKAILLYPMNALANDQRNRLRDYLRGTGVTFARYTGDLKSRDEQPEPPPEAPPEELWNREQVRETPPDILLTNYAMLELLLIRNEDQRIFRDGALRFLVLDEIHTYQGALGSEIACLIRRLKEHTGLATGGLVCIGTSATVESPERNTPALVEDPRALVARFAQNLFGEPFAADDVVREAYAPLPSPAGAWPPAPALTDADLVLPEVEAEAPPAALALARRLTGSAAGSLPQDPLAAHAELQTLLAVSPVVAFLERELAQPRPLEELAELLAQRPERHGLTGDALRRELSAYLVAGSTAAPGQAPRLRPKLHLFFRGPYHITRCLACGRLHLNGAARCDGCAGETAAIEPPEGAETLAATLPFEVCRLCGQDFLKARMDHAPFGAARGRGRRAAQEELPELVQLRPDTERDSDKLLTVHLTKRLFALVTEDEDAAEQEDAEDGGAPTPPPARPRRGSDDEDEEPEAPLKQQEFWVCVRCRRATNYQLSACAEPDCGGPVERYLGFTGRLLQCPTCRGRHGSDEVVIALSSGTPSSISALCTSLMSGLTREDERRLLIFSDSRQDAAFQAGYIGDRQDRFTWRQLISRIVHDRADKGEPPIRLAGLADAVLDYAVEHGIRGRPATRDERATAADAINWDILFEFTRPGARRVNLEDLGLVEAGYGYLEDLAGAPAVAALAEEFDLRTAEVTGFLAQMLDEMRHRRALSAPPLLSYIPRSGLSRRGGQEQPGSRAPRFDRTPVGFGDVSIPRGHSYQIKRITGVKHYTNPIEDYAVKVLGGSGAEGRELARRFLDRCRALLTDDASGPAYLTTCAIGSPHDEREALMVNLARVEVRPPGRAYRCSVCQRLFPRSIRGACPTWRCKGSLRRIEPDQDEDLHENYYLRMYERHPVSIRVAEHSGAISGEKKEQEERDFVEGKLNVLVCTPTMELGVDIGQLVTMIMRNVPPLPSNYAQRAGRAGRSGGLALINTFCQISPHDTYFYEWPERVIRGAIRPPVFLIDNQRVIRRHIRSLVLEKCRTQLRGLMKDYLNEEDLTLTGLEPLFEEIHQRQTEIVAAVRTAFARDLTDGRIVSLDADEIEGAVAGFAAEMQDALFPWLTRVRSVAEELDALPRRALSYEQQQRRSYLDRVYRSLTEDRQAAYPLRFLAQLGFLPSYAFPGEQIVLESPIDATLLTREKEVGLVEYAPGNLVYVDLHKLQVTGVAFRRTGDQPSEGQAPAVYKVCGHEGCDFISFTPSDQYCDHCHEPLKDFNYLEAKAFRADDEGRITSDEEARAREGYTVQRYLVDEGSRQTRYAYPEMPAVYQRRAAVFAVNTGFIAPPQPGQPAPHGFEICAICGDWHDPKVKTADWKARHQLRRKHEAELRPFDFAVKIDSDVLVLDVDPPGGASPAYLATLRNALQSGVEIQMETLSREVSGFDRSIRFTRSEGAEAGGREQEVRLHQIVLYETVPGGAGYLERAVRELPEIARRMLDVFDGCGCVDSCYACLRSYTNQREHELLDKRLVIPFLQQLALASVPEGEPEGPAEAGARRGQDLEARWQFERERQSLDRTESPIEEQLLAALRQAGLPEPAQQYEIYAPEGWLISRADFAYPEERILIYCDGWQWHGEREAWEHDLRQSNTLQRQGWLVLRFPGTRIFRDADACAREIGHCLGERAAAAPAGAE